MEWYLELRSEFPLTSTQIYLNVATHNPMATSVVEAMHSFWTRRSRDDCKGYDSTLAAETVRQQIVRLINCGPEEVVFTKNTSEGLNIVASGFPWKPGDNVIIVDQDHPSNLLPWLNQRRRGVEVLVARSVDSRVPLESVWSLVTSRTRVIALSFVQYMSGYRADLAALGRLCRNRGIRLVVDGIQGVGALSFDARSMHVDAMSCAAYKHLLGPQGIGFLYCSGDVLEELVPAYASPSSAIVLERVGQWHMDVADLRDASRLQGGSQNHAGIVGLGAGLALLEKHGTVRIEQRVLALAAHLASGLAELGYKVLASPEAAERSGLVSVSVADAVGFDEYLWSNGIKASWKTEAIERFSIHAYNLEAEIDRVLEVAAAYNRRGYLPAPSA